MTKLKKPIVLETTFGQFTIDELIGEGGAGKVYGGSDIDGTPIAIKMLAQDRATNDKRKRFKNEIAFLANSSHPNLVKVIDHGVAQSGDITGPFYVMPRYNGNLRDYMESGIAPPQALKIFTSILDGVEAAHLKGAIHRDLKPENILCVGNPPTVAIADFGVARFTEELLVTAVETGAAQRLANFQYAAPEQRVRGGRVNTPADIFALGMILNELFTGNTPQGTNYKLIASVSPEHAFLDPIVEAMIRQEANTRPQSIEEVKNLIGRYRADEISKQRLSAIDASVIKAGTIDDPLALEPPRLIDAEWNAGRLTLTLDKAVTTGWINALHNMPSYGAVMGIYPATFIFRGNHAVVDAPEHVAQAVIDNFKNWLPIATRTLKSNLEQQNQAREREERERLRREKEAIELRQRVNKNLKI